ncbi:hypothetical protein ACRTC7_03195 [Vibrio fluvialis]|uniref:hypothetical protein n=1 Tax=Vibrio fluvialis TaxID=676 RepID=UPI003D7E2F73
MTDFIQQFQFDFSANEIDWSESDIVNCLTRVLIQASIKADQDTRAINKNLFRCAAYFLDKNHSPFYEAYFDIPLSYFGCFKTLYDMVLQETDLSKVKYQLSTDGIVIPWIVPFPANENVSEEVARNEYKRVIDEVLSRVIRIENIDIHPLIQNKGIFKALVAALLENYRYVMITAVINKRWADSLKRKALEVYEEPRGTAVILDRSFLEVIPDNAIDQCLISDKSIKKVRL